MSNSYTYVVKTNLPPEAVSRIGVEIFTAWLAFALGEDSLAGKRLIYPTGRYAASLSIKQVDASTVAIIADESVAPEAAILETGHRRFDMKTVTSLKGRAIPMHRPVGETPGTKLKRIGGGPPGLKPQMWAEVHASTRSGFASFGPNSPPDSWVVPAMASYAPGLTLSIMAKKMASDLGG